MKRDLILAIIVIIFLAACGDMAAKPAATGGSMEIYQPIVMAAGVGETTGAFLMIKNNGSQDDRLLGAACDVADMTQVHETLMENDIMSMREVQSIEIPAGQKLELKHGSYHIMLMGLKKDLNEGQMVTITLKFEKAGEIPVSVMVMKK